MKIYFAPTHAVSIPQESPGAAVGAVAEQAGHHPDLHLTAYRTIEVRLSTHARGGITINDLIVAAV